MKIRKEKKNMTTEFKRKDMVFFFDKESRDRGDKTSPRVGFVLEVIEGSFLEGSPEYLRLSESPLALTIESSILIPSSKCILCETLLERLNSLPEDASDAIEYMWSTKEDD